jgi:hypothetical protein
MRMSRKKHYWLVIDAAVTDGKTGFLSGNVVKSRKELKEYLEGEGDYRVLDIEELFIALSEAKSIRKTDDGLIIIHFVVEGDKNE